MTSNRSTDGAQEIGFPKTYRAMQAIRPGVLELVERETPEPEAGEVLLRVEACGICRADAGTIDGQQFPRVPGHEVVGRIAAVGAGTPAPWRVGQRVGVGRLGGHCNACDQCRRGQFSSAGTSPSSAPRATAAMQR